jgi:hypothetical protein
MWHVVPHLECHVDARCAGGQPGGVVEEDRGVTDVDEDRRKASEIGDDGVVDGGRKRVLGCQPAVDAQYRACVAAETRASRRRSVTSEPRW